MCKVKEAPTFAALAKEIAALVEEKNAALIAIVKVIDRADDRGCPAGALEMARAAIKKAEGRSK